LCPQNSEIGILSHSYRTAGFDFSFSPDEIVHIRDHHGDLARERARGGQRAVTPEDFARLPEILQGSRPRLTAELSRSRQLPVFEIATEIEGETYVTEWEYWSGRRTLTLLTFFVRSRKKRK